VNCAVQRYNADIQAAVSEIILQTELEATTESSEPVVDQLTKLKVVEVDAETTKEQPPRVVMTVISSVLM